MMSCLKLILMIGVIYGFCIDSLKVYTYLIPKYVDQIEGDGLKLLHSRLHSENQVEILAETIFMPYKRSLDSFKKDSTSIFIAIENSELTKEFDFIPFMQIEIKVLQNVLLRKDHLPDEFLNVIGDSLGFSISDQMKLKPHFIEDWNLAARMFELRRSEYLICGQKFCDSILEISKNRKLKFVQGVNRSLSLGVFLHKTQNKNILRVLTGQTRDN